MKEFDFDPHNLPAEFRAAIGHAIACAAQTEGILGMAIAACARIDFETGLALTTHMTVPQKVSALRTLAEIHIDDLDALDTLDEIIGNLETASTKRNDIVHHEWCRDPDTNDVFRVKFVARTSLMAEQTLVTVEQIEADAEFIRKAGMALSSFMIEHGIEPIVPPPRPRAHKTKAARRKRKQGGKSPSG
jgi:hypothetical protein